MKRLFLILAGLLTLIAADACTSAIVSGKLTRNGRPLLWKNRDTDDQNNRVERVPRQQGKLEFIALFDARDLRDTAAWMGLNEKGFAVMNTASYNLNGKDGVTIADREGVVMRMALETCVTVDDFERLLQRLPKPLGVEANFGVIDAQGNGAYFETGNYTYVKYDLADEPSGILVRTNYSYSGKEGAGYGYIRHESAVQLLAPHIEARDFTPAVFTEEISRSFFHSQLGEDFTNSGREWLVDQDFIPRRISTASIVVEGVLPWENPRQCIMWTALGYPPCAEVFACTVGEGGVDVALTGTTKENHSTQCDIVKKRKAEVFPTKRGNGKYYIRLKKLYNAEGTGYCQQLVKKNLAVYERGDEIRRNQLRSAK